MKRSLQVLGIGSAACVCALAFANSSHAAPPVYGEESESFTDAALQPLRDLNVTRHKIRAPLKEAAAAPYDLSDIDGCPAIRAEISELDSVLGPDVDATGAQKTNVAHSLIANALSGVVKVPFRGVVRRLSGAERHDREIHEAEMAGMARRAFLKGVAAARCPDTPYLQVAASAPHRAPPPRVLRAPTPTVLASADFGSGAQAEPAAYAPPPEPIDADYAESFGPDR